MTLGRLWTFLAVGLPVLGALLANLTTVDLAYHLRAGAMTLDSGVIPMTDSFTFTAAGQPWLNQQWGAQVVLAAVYRVAGWTGLVVLRAVLVGLLTGLLYLACRRQGLSRRAASWLALSAFIVTAVALGLRPQLFGTVLLACLLVLVVDRRDQPARLWLAVPIVLAWANLHGSFFLGPVVLGLAWLQDVHDGVPRAWRTLLVAIAAAAVAVVNPFGPAVWGYAAGLSMNPLVTSRITEWQPTSLRSIPGMLFFGSALLVALLLARSGRRASWPTLLWLGVFFVIGAYAIRGVAWWPIGAVVAVAGLIAETDSRASREVAEPSRPANVAVALGLVVAAVGLLPAWRPIDPALGAPVGVVGLAPPGITDRLRQLSRPGDRLFNPQPWGSWFELALPEVPVAIDSRIEVFPAAAWSDYEAVAGARADWSEILDRWAVTIVVAAGGEDEPLAGVLRRHGGWTEAYADGDGRIYVRADR